MQTKNLGKIDLIAEIGGNHEGNFDYAQRLNALAIGSAANVVKYQLYTGGTIANRLIDPGRFEHFKKFELKKEQHEILAKQCISAGKEYLASVWDIDFLNFIDPYLKRYKVGSGDLTNKLLIEEFCKRGKPIILSTGLAHFDEVESCVKFIRSQSEFYSASGSISIMQCTSMYPINESDANLSVIPTYMNLQNITPGYSDHTKGIDALVYSVALGARILEFHFTDDRSGKTFRDHSVSLTQKEVHDLKLKLEGLDTLYGNSFKLPLKIEMESDHIKTFRRGIYFNRDVKAGEVVNNLDLVALRPNQGISAWDADKIIGKKCLIDIEKLRPLDTKMFG